MVTFFDEINYPKFSLRSGDIDELCELIKDNKFELLIIDHYGFSHKDERAIKEKTGVKILSFDDTYEKHFFRLRFKRKFICTKDKI